MQLNKVFLQGKNSGDTCEDGYVFHEQYAAVVDGVTSKSKYLFSGKTPGRIGMEVLCRQIPLLEPDLSAAQAVSQLNLALRGARADMSREHTLTLADYPRACAAIYSSSRREIWLIGDCQCIVNGKAYTNPKKIDDIMLQLRSYVLQCEQFAGKTEQELAAEDPGRQAILPFLKKQFLFENSAGSFGYPVLNGEEIIASQLVVIPVPAGSRVTLATDGYPALFESFDESEAALQVALVKDPLCYKENPQTKGIQSGNVSFDDRCYLQFTT